jgi:hypothetical protein
VFFYHLWNEETKSYGDRTGKCDYVQFEVDMFDFDDIITQLNSTKRVSHPEFGGDETWNKVNGTIYHFIMPHFERNEVAYDWVKSM